MEFRVLGPVEVIDGGGTVALGGPKQRALLAKLLLSRGAAVPRDQLVDALWGDEPPASAASSLQVYVHGLRRALGADRLETKGAAYRIRLEPEELDLERFEALVERGRHAVAADAPHEADGALATALSLWRGEPLTDLGDSPVRTAASGLEELRRQALELRIDARLALGGHAEVIPTLEELVAAEPYRERFRAQLITALYRAGRQVEALEAYRETRERWREELGLEPSPELQELERSVLRQDATLEAPPPPRRVASRLPAPVTPLVGRRLEVASVVALLRTEARLVTLLGPGGTGKTRLALAVAHSLGSELPGGAVFVDLAPVSDPELLVPEIARSVGVEGPASVDEVAAQIGDSPLLLVLDNVEQLLDGAEAVAELLRETPRLRVLATSRRPLALAGEHEYRVPPLPLPLPTARPEEIAQSEAVQLFLARARAAGSDLAADESLADLCRRLDGLPLALELAAARTKVLAPAEIAAGLPADAAALASRARDVPARQTTLAATLEWSLGLLDKEERRAFAALGVFAGGCTAEAAERLGVELGTLAALVDHSLVHLTDATAGRRFGMLETIRSFAVARASEEDRRAHAEWLTGLAEGVEEALAAGADAAPAIDALDAEIDNLRAALEWSLRADAVDLGLRLLTASRPLWEIRGHLREGSRWAGDLLLAAGDRWPELRAKGLGFAGTFELRAGRLAEAEERWTAMLELYEELGDEEGIARGLSDVGTVAAAAGDYDRSAELLERAAEGFRRLGIAKRLSVVVSNLGHVAAQRGDVAGAIALTREALDLQRELGDDQRQAVSLNNLGGFAVDTGELVEAREWLRECVELGVRLGYKEVLAHALSSYARMAAAGDDWPAAARCALLADRLLAEAGAEIPGGEGARFEALKTDARATLGEDGYAAARAEMEEIPLEDLPGTLERLERKARGGSPRKRP